MIESYDDVEEYSNRVFAFGKRSRVFRGTKTLDSVVTVLFDGPDDDFVRTMKERFPGIETENVGDDGGKESSAIDRF